MLLNKVCSCGVHLSTKSIVKLEKSKKFGFRKAFFFNCKGCLSTGMLVSKSYDIRLQYFESLKNHPLYKKTMPLLKKDGVEYCIQFIKEFGYLKPDMWALKANRIFLDQEKPHYYAVANEILIAVGTGTDFRDIRRRMR